MTAPTNAAAIERVGSYAKGPARASHGGALAHLVARTAAAIETVYRIAAAGAIGACPSAHNSSGPSFRGSRPICRPSDPVSVDAASVRREEMRRVETF